MLPNQTLASTSHKKKKEGQGAPYIAAYRYGKCDWDKETKTPWLLKVHSAMVS
jgi:hypothetical protein